MNTRPPFVAHVEPAKPMEPGQRAFDDPSRAAQPTAVGRAALGELAGDPAAFQRVSMRLRIVGPVALDQPWLADRAAWTASERRNRVDQGQQLGDVVPIGAGQQCRQRDAARLGENVVLRPRLTAIGWVRSSFFPRATLARSHCRRGHASDPTGRAGATRQAAARAAGARLRRVATAPGVASTCCPSHSPFPSGAFLTSNSV